jgi:hypothetical protein
MASGNIRGTRRLMVRLVIDNERQHSAFCLSSTQVSGCTCIDRIGLRRRLDSAYSRTRSQQAGDGKSAMYLSGHLCQPVVDDRCGPSGVAASPA